MGAIEKLGLKNIGDACQETSRGLAKAIWNKAGINGNFY
jgi:hypothetical protein